MNKEWSELNKTMQSCLKGEENFRQGLTLLFELRHQLADTLKSFLSDLSRDDFNAMPFINSNGYHNKTIAYSVWHIFRIEDIVANTLITNDDQIFFKKDYQRLINAPITTTGNELAKQQISDFSKQLNLDALYSYAFEVQESTEDIINSLSFKDLRNKIPLAQKHKLIGLNVVSQDPNSNWLIDYWCRKDIRGLIQMPFSRHWIMHTEAALRIADKLHRKI